MLSIFINARQDSPRVGIACPVCEARITKFTKVQGTKIILKQGFIFVTLKDAA